MEHASILIKKSCLKARIFETEGLRDHLQEKKSVRLSDSEVPWFYAINVPV